MPITPRRSNHPSGQNRSPSKVSEHFQPAKPPPLKRVAKAKVHKPTEGKTNVAMSPSHKGTLPFRKFSKVIVVGCTGNVLAAWINHHIYSTDHPAWTYNVEQMLNAHSGIQEKMNIHCVATRSNKTDPKYPMLFNRKTQRGEDQDPNAPDAKPPLNQTVFVGILEDGVPNVAKTRKIWATNIAKLFHQATGKEAQFHNDVTPEA